MAMRRRHIIAFTITIFLNIGLSSTRDYSDDKAASASERNGEDKKVIEDKELEGLRAASQQLSQLSHSASDVLKLLGSGSLQLDVTGPGDVKGDDTDTPEGMTSSQTQEGSSEGSSQSADLNDRETVRKIQKRQFGSVLGRGYKMGKRYTNDLNDEVHQTLMELSNAFGADTVQPETLTSPAHHGQGQELTDEPNYGESQPTKRQFGKVLRGGYKLGKRFSSYSPGSERMPRLPYRYYRGENPEYDEPFRSITSMPTASFDTETMYFLERPRVDLSHWGPPLSSTPRRETALKGIFRRLQTSRIDSDYGREIFHSQNVGLESLFPGLRSGTERNDLEGNYLEGNYWKEVASEVAGLLETARRLLTTPPAKLPSTDHDVNILSPWSPPSSEELPIPEEILRCIQILEARNEGCRSEDCLTEQEKWRELERCEEMASSRQFASSFQNDQSTNGQYEPRERSANRPLPERIRSMITVTPKGFSDFLADKENREEDQEHEKLPNDMEDTMHNMAKVMTKSKFKEREIKVEKLPESIPSSLEKLRQPLKPRKPKVDVAFSRQARGVHVLGSGYKTGKSPLRQLKRKPARINKRWFFNWGFPKGYKLGKRKEDDIAQSEANFYPKRDPEHVQPDSTQPEHESLAIIDGLENYLFRLRQVIDDLGEEKRFIWKNPRGYGLKKRNFDSTLHTNHRQDYTEELSETPENPDHLDRSLDGLEIELEAEGHTPELASGSLQSPDGLGEGKIYLGNLQSKPFVDRTSESLEDLDTRKRDVSAPLVDRRFESGVFGLNDVLSVYNLEENIQKSLYIGKRGSPSPFMTPVVDRRYESRSLTIPGLNPGGTIWDGDFWDYVGVLGKRGQSDQSVGFSVNRNHGNDGSFPSAESVLDMDKRFLFETFGKKWQRGAAENKMERAKRMLVYLFTLARFKNKPVYVAHRMKRSVSKPKPTSNKFENPQGFVVDKNIIFHATTNNSKSPVTAQKNISRFDSKDEKSILKVSPSKKPYWSFRGGFGPFVGRPRSPHSMRKQTANIYSKTLWRNMVIEFQRAKSRRKRVSQSEPYFDERDYTTAPHSDLSKRLWGYLLGKWHSTRPVKHMNKAERLYSNLKRFWYNILGYTTGKHPPLFFSSFDEEDSTLLANSDTDPSKNARTGRIEYHTFGKRQPLLFSSPNDGSGNVGRKKRGWKDAKENSRTAVYEQQPNFGHVENAGPDSFNTDHGLAKRVWGRIFGFYNFGQRYPALPKSSSKSTLKRTWGNELNDINFAKRALPSQANTAASYDLETSSDLEKDGISFIIWRILGGHHRGRRTPDTVPAFLGVLKPITIIRESDTATEDSSLDVRIGRKKL